MAFEERVQILSEAEQDELYGPPAFTSADQRFFFSLNDKELAVAKSVRHRAQRYMFVVLLGYFKAKPVVLNPGFHQIKQDLKYVYQTVLPGPGCRPFNLTPQRCPPQSHLLTSENQHSASRNAHNRVGACA